MVDLRRILLFHEVDFSSASKKTELLDIFQREIRDNAPQLKQAIATRLSESVIAAEPIQYNSPHRTRAETSKVEPTPRKRGRLSKPFVDPTAEEDTREPKANVTPVKNLSVRSRNKDGARDSASPSAEGSPFSNVNFFQSPSSERKRPLDIDTSSSRKKHETSTPARDRKSAPASTPKVEDAYATPQGETPPEFVPQTAPLARHSAPFIDKTFSNYSTGKSLRGSGAGRRISFMPKVDVLNMSKPFAEQVGKHDTIEDTPTKCSKPGRDTVQIESTKEEQDIQDLEDELVEEELAQEEDQPIVEEEPAPESLVPFFQVAGIALAFILFAAAARWWVNEKFEAGYCEVGFNNWTPPMQYQSRFTPTTLGEYFDKEYLLDLRDDVLDYVRPDCQPCPQHAICYPNFRVECEAGFVKEENVLGNILPLPPKCRPDTQTKKRVQLLVQKAVSILRERNAKALCEHGPVEIEEGDLRQILYGMKAATLSDEEFQDLWSVAVQDLMAVEEVVVRETKYKQNRTREAAHGITDTPGHVVKPTSVFTQNMLRSTSQARVPLFCAVKLSVLHRLQAHRGKVISVLLVLVAIVSTRQWQAARHRRRAHAERLASLAIARLKAQRAQALADERGRTPRAVPVPHLRDEIQSDVKQLAARKRTWRDVEVQVETNANVRARQSEVDGEIMRVWEWVGL